MRTPHFSSNDLTQLQRQLRCWRERQTGPRPIPAQAWEAATALARIHGASRVGRTLHLDYYKLRQRLGAEQGSSPRATFVEVGWPSTPAGVSGAAGACSVELSNGGARRLRMHLAADAGTLAALTRAFFQGEP